MHWHQLRSRLDVPQVFQITSHMVGFHSVLRVVNSINYIAVTIYSIVTCTRIPRRDIHTAKMVLWSVVFTDGTYYEGVWTGFFVTPSTNPDTPLPGIMKNAMYLAPSATSPTRCAWFWVVTANWEETDLMHTMLEWCCEDLHGKHLVFSPAVQALTRALWCAVWQPQLCHDCCDPLGGLRSTDK